MSTNFGNGVENGQIYLNIIKSSTMAFVRGKNRISEQYKLGDDLKKTLLRNVRVKR